MISLTHGNPVVCRSATVGLSQETERRFMHRVGFDRRAFAARVESASLSLRIHRSGSISLSTVDRLLLSGRDLDYAVVTPPGASGPHTGRCDRHSLWRQHDCAESSLARRSCPLAASGILFARFLV